MDKLESIKVFVAVARAGGFSAASRELGQPLATVSRKVGELEKALGVRLFERTTRQVVLTDRATPYFEACRRLLEDLREADALIVGEHRAPKGELTITAPTGFGRIHLQPVALEFLHAYPQIDMRLMLVDQVIDLIDEHVDLAVRVKLLPDSALIARAVGAVKMVVCASPAYLQAAGVPAHPDELAAHRCIAWASLGPFKAWSFRIGDVEVMAPIGVRLTTTMPDSALDAAVAGLGLVQVTSYQAEASVRAGLLVPVLREFEAEPTPVNLVHPQQPSRAAKVASLHRLCRSASGRAPARSELGALSRRRLCRPGRPGSRSQALKLRFQCLNACCAPRQSPSRHPLRSVPQMCREQLRSPVRTPRSSAFFACAP